MDENIKNELNDLKQKNISPVFSNYKRSNKLFGIIEYKNLIVIFFVIFITYSILKTINITMEYKIYIFIFINLPIVLLFLININNDNIIDVCINIIKYSVSNKIYVSFHNKDYNEEIKNILKFKKSIKKYKL